MRKILFVVSLMLFLTIGAFAQEPAQQQTEKSLDELRAKWAQEDKDRELKYLADNRKETESAFTTYNGLVQQRDGELTQKLKRAVADGDETPPCARWGLLAGRRCCKSLERRGFPRLIRALRRGLAVNNRQPCVPHLRVSRATYERPCRVPF